MYSAETKIPGTIFYSSDHIKIQTDYFDYGIYIDPGKAFIISINEFEENQPTLIRTELHPEQQLKSMDSFIPQIIGRLYSPHRILIFGPSDDKYTLHKALQKGTTYNQVTKELRVARQMDKPEDAQLFTEQHFRSRPSF
jgi:hypothetical protein